MADQYNKKKQGPFIPRTESQKILTSDEMGSKIQNMVVTEEGTLRGVCGPAPYVPNYDGGYPSYGTPHGIHHAIIAKTGRDLLLLHNGDQLWVHQGWNIDVTSPNDTWEVLLGPSSASPMRVDPLPNPTVPTFPTQFESTPMGVVIVPQGGRSFFYDGTTILPLGYDHAPAAPSGLGPQGVFAMAIATVPKANGTNHSLATGADAKRWSDLNSNRFGYSKSGATSWVGGGYYDRNGMCPEFGFCEIGTLQVSPGVHATTNTATLLPGLWQCKTQWIDKWGNLSPLSSVSNPITVEQERGDYGSPWELDTEYGEAVQDTFYKGFRSARLLKQFLWNSISPGPDGTVGRVLVRTKDQINSGTLDYFEISPDKIGSFSGFATIPDNTTTCFPDNVGDAGLAGLAVDPIPVPLFRLCRLAFGRLWIANLSDRPGIVIPSLPGRWGTFERNVEYEPDPTGSEVTALWRGFGGLFVFTQNSTFMITPSATVQRNEQQGFQVETVNSGIGCVGPNAIQTMQDGSLIWMGIDGFYRATMSRKEGLQISPISDEIERTFRNLNKPRFRAVTSVLDDKSGEYRCWVPDQNSKTNNLCLIYDGSGWRRRTDTKARASCTTVDHRRYSLVAGESPGTTVTSRTEATGLGQVYSGYAAGVDNPPPPSGNIIGTDNPDSADSVTVTNNNVWVLDHEVPSFVPSTRDYTVETSWIGGLRSLDRKTAFTVYIWLRETSKSTLNVEVYRDWRMDVVHTETANVYSTEDTPPFWGTAELGSTNTYKLRRPFWVKADLFLPACEAFRLRLTCQHPFEFVGISVAEGGPDDSGMRIPK